jgi:hypothetical protein
MNPKQIQYQIEAIKKQLAELGPMHPGSLSEQFNVCGNPGCRCKDSNDPQRHGPYYQLSYTWRGKSFTRFVRQAVLAKTRKKVANYKRMQKLVKKWVDFEMELERQDRAARRNNPINPDNLL